MIQYSVRQVIGAKFHHHLQTLKFQFHLKFALYLVFNGNFKITSYIFLVSQWLHFDH